MNSVKVSMRPNVWGMIPIKHAMMCTIQLIPHIGPKKVQVVQSCPALCDPMDYRAHGILQDEWVAYPFFSGSSRPRDRTQDSCIVGRFFTNWAMREAPVLRARYYHSSYFINEEISEGLTCRARGVEHLPSFTGLASAREGLKPQSI